MKKKGFTLIELLAVIVVLAIIALIATPIVMNVIKDAQKGAVERSAEGYLKAVEIFISTEQLENSLIEDGIYTVNEDGNLVLGGKTLTVEVNGDKPKKESKVAIKNGEVVKEGTTLEFEGYTVTIDNNGRAKAEEKGSEVASIICNAISPTKQQVWNDTSSVMEEKVVGIQLAGFPYIFGTIYSCDLGDGPRTFYVLKADGDNVKLIMNENLDGTAMWCDQNGDNPNNIICAGDGAKAHLISQTSGWTKLASVGGTVELPEAQDLASGAPDWVRVNLSENSGYWTSTPSNDRAQYVLGMGFITTYKIDEFYGGVRPVITIPKANMSF